MIIKKEFEPLGLALMMFAGGICAELFYIRVFGYDILVPALSALVLFLLGIAINIFLGRSGEGK